VGEGGPEARPPIWQLIAQAASELSPPFTAQEIQLWFAERYPEIAVPTLRSQVAVLTGNNQSYLSSPTYSQRPPILWSVGWGEYEPYDESVHGSPRLTDDSLPHALAEAEGRPAIRRLIEVSSRELIAPFTVQDMLDWFADHYPDVLVPTIRAQMVVVAGNSPAYLFNDTYNRRPPILWRVSRGVYEPYDREKHGDIATPNAGFELLDDAEEAIETAQEFFLEQYLEEFLFDNWGRIEFGRPLELWSPDHRSARQFDTGDIGRLDFLCRDTSTDSLIVMELKRGTPSDAVVGQTLRYVGWVKENLARADQRVEGIIVVSEPDERLQFSVLATPNLHLRRYNISFSLEAAG
jgi:hypothetical protein